MKRIPIAVAAVAAGALALTGCTPAPAPDTDTGSDPITVRIASNLNATALPIWVAETEGYFEDAGLNVEYTKVDNISTLPTALGTTFDIVLATPTTLISASSQGIDIKWVSGSSVDTSEAPVNNLMVMADSGIESPADLEGKTLGVLVETGTLHIATMNWLKEEGVDLSSLTIVQVDGPNHADQLSSGRIDAVETTAPFGSQIEAAGGTSLGNPYRVLGDPITPILWASNGEWAEQNPGAISGFIEALDRAADFIADDEGAAREILKERTGFADDVVANFPLPQYDTTIRPEDLDTWLAAMKEVTEFNAPVDVSTLVYRTP